MTVLVLFCEAEFEIEGAYRFLSVLCKEKSLPYHTLKGKSFPIQFGTYTIYKFKVLNK